MPEKDYIEIVALVQGTEKIQRIDGIISELMNRAKTAGVNVDDFAEELKELASESENASDEMGNFNEELETGAERSREAENSYNKLIVKMKKIAGIAAIGMGIKKSINIFSAFDDVARKVQATTGADAESMELLRFQAKELGRTTSWSASQASEAQFEFAKAGFNNNEILSATGGILNIATAAQLGLAEATAITAGVLRMFKMNASESNKVGDILAKTANSTSTDVQGLGESLKYAGKDAYDFKMSLAETSAILGSLGNEMLKDSSAGTGLQAVFASFKDKNKAKILIEAGVQLSEDGQYRNFLDIVKDLKKQTANMSEVETKSLINQVFGEQGSRVMNRLLGQPEEELQKLIEELENSSGYAKDVAAIYEDGIGGAFRGLASATEGLGISIGEYLAPVVISLINGATDLIGIGTGVVEWLNSGSYAADTLSFALTSLIAGYGIYKGILMTTAIWEKISAGYMFVKNGIMSTATFIMGLFNAEKRAGIIAETGLQVALGIGAIAHFLYGQAVMVATGQIGIMSAAVNILNAGLALLSLPVTVVVAAIVGLGVGFYVLYKKSEKFRKAIDPLIKKIQDLWGWVKKFTFVGTVIDGVKSVVGKGKELLTAGTQGKTKEELNNEIEQAKQQVQAGSGNLEEKEKGPGKNTDYLLSGSGKIKHNGYYLRGTNNSTVSRINNSNIYNSKKATTSGNDNIYTAQQPEKTIEEKILDTLMSIKSLLSGRKKGSNSVNTEEARQVIINIGNKEIQDENIAQLVDDLIIAIENLGG